jgi:hypothetical protein
MGRTVFLHLASHGYEAPEERFGYRGAAVRLRPGGRATLTLRRLNVARRLYRLTGAGIYRDSLLVGRPPGGRFTADGPTIGQDSVSTVVHRGRIHWFWGDSLRPEHPLGNFRVTGAVSLPPAGGGLDPEVGVDLEYFVDERGFARPMVEMPDEGAVWLEAPMVLHDGGEERMFAAFSRVAPGLNTRERGLLAYDDSRSRFVPLASFPVDAPARPAGHAFEAVDGGRRNFYFATPYPLVRVAATAEALADPNRYQAFTPLRPDGSVERTARGALAYRWRYGAPPLDPERRQELVEAGTLAPEEGAELRDLATGEPVASKAGSVAWNRYRRRWVMIAQQVGGSSHLGEIWYAEADTPLGPWVYAVKVVTHDTYSFYNPKHHPMLDPPDGRVLYFDATYSTLFSGRREPTPLYDYNQVLYALDLDDPRLVLPVPVYDPGVRAGIGPATRSELRLEGAGPADERPAPAIPFFALDRLRPGAVRIGRRAGGGLERLDADARGRATAFFALPPSAPEQVGTGLLYEVTEGDGPPRYELAPRDAEPARPLCRVWRNPVPTPLPASALHTQPVA